MLASAPSPNGLTRPVALAVVLCLSSAASLTHGSPNIRSDQSGAWGANVGWLNWNPDPVNGAEIAQYVCAGYIYGANLGWIDLGSGTPANGVEYANNSASDFGVNVDAVGHLRGLAYGANIGWVNFENLGNPRVDLQTGQLSGFAYGANIGWINLGDATVALSVGSIPGGTDQDGDGLPDAWELTNVGDLTTLSATGDADQDGQTDLEEYLADTDPLDPTDRLTVTQLSFTPDQSQVSVTWTTKPTRQYQIEIRSAIDPSSPWVDSSLGVIAPDGARTTRVLPVQGEQLFLRVRARRPLGP